MQEDIIKEFQILMTIIEGYEDERITFEKLVNYLHEYGFGLVMLMFSLPSCIPIPVAGVTPILAAPLFFIAVQMIAGRDHPWLPNWLKKKSASKESLINIIKKVSGIMIKTKNILKKIFPIHKSKTLGRLTKYINAKFEIGERTIGFFSFIFATSIAVPLPFTNFLPGIAIFMMSKGLLNKNSFLIINGMLVGIIGTLLTVTILIVGEKVIRSILPF